MHTRRGRVKCIFYAVLVIVPVNVLQSILTEARVHFRSKTSGLV